MSNLIKGLFGKSVNLKEIHAGGAVIVDVRTPEEFHSGHIAGAVNIPLDRVRGSISELKTSGAPVIVCCLSGTRSSAASGMLSKAGIETYNGGGWKSLERALR